MRGCTVQIQTSRFGKIEVDETKVIEMKGPILGFGSLNKFAMIVHEEGSPFHWLQSLDDGTIAFIIVDPFLIKPDYEPEIDDQALAMLEVEHAQDVNLKAIITIRSQPVKITANLRAPLVINKHKKLAGQVILEDEQYPVQYTIG